MGNDGRGGGAGGSCVAAKGAHGNVPEELFVLTVGALPPCALRACGSAFDVRIPRRRGGGPVGGGGALVQIWVLLRRIPGEDLFWGFGRVEAQDPPPPLLNEVCPRCRSFVGVVPPQRLSPGAFGGGAAAALCAGVGRGRARACSSVFGGGGMRGAATVEVRTSAPPPPPGPAALSTTTDRACAQGHVE